MNIAISQEKQTNKQIGYQIFFCQRNYLFCSKKEKQIVNNYMPSSSSQFIAAAVVLSSQFKL